MRDYRKHRRDHGRLKILLITGVGIILTGNAFLQMGGGRGPLTGLLMQPIQTVLSLLNERSKPAPSQPELVPTE